MEEFFNGESSFISESVDDMDECTPELGLEAEPDIVASSSTPFGDLIKHTYNESERSIHEGLFSSHDIVKSFILSLADPLCSIVPCSISSYDDPIKKTEENGKKFINSTAIVGLQNLNRKSLGLQNLNTKAIVHHQSAQHRRGKLQHLLLHSQPRSQSPVRGIVSAPLASPTASSLIRSGFCIQGYKVSFSRS